MMPSASSRRGACSGRRRGSSSPSSRRSFSRLPPAHFDGQLRLPDRVPAADLVPPLRDVVRGGARLGPTADGPHLPSHPARRRASLPQDAEGDRAVVRLRHRPDPHHHRQFFIFTTIYVAARLALWARRVRKGDSTVWPKEIMDRIFFPVVGPGVLGWYPWTRPNEHQALYCIQAVMLLQLLYIGFSITDPSRGASGVYMGSMNNKQPPNFCTTSPSCRGSRRTTRRACTRCTPSSRSRASS